MTSRKCGSLDVMVGARIRMLRINRGMSEAVLAKRVGVTFGQVQKYERGIHRVGASRLSRIASVLGISVGELFESSAAGSSGLNSPLHRLGKPGALRVLNAYARTINPRVRPGIAKLIESIADRRSRAKATSRRPDGAVRSDRRRLPFH